MNTPAGKRFISAEINRNPAGLLIATCCRCGNAAIHNALVVNKLCLTFPTYSTPQIRLRLWYRYKRNTTAVAAAEVVSIRQHREELHGYNYSKSCKLRVAQCRKFSFFITIDHAFFHLQQQKKHLTKRNAEVCINRNIGLLFIQTFVQIN